MDHNLRKTTVEELARELHVRSEQILEKCQKEGIPKSHISTPKSPLGAGMEAAIREWFWKDQDDGDECGVGAKL